MISVLLREITGAYARRTGELATYERIANPWGIAGWAPESLAGRETSNPALDLIGRLREATLCAPSDLPERVPSPKIRELERS